MSQPVQMIELDASTWRTVNDFYEAMLSALGAPEWHGRNANALVESMIWMDINEMQPPYIVDIRGTQDLPAAVRAELAAVREAVRNIRTDYRNRTGREMDINFLADP